MVAELESDLQETVDRWRKWLVDSSAGKTQLVLFDQSNNTAPVDVKMDGSVLEKNHILCYWDCPFFSKLDRGSYIISIATTGSKKIGTLVRLMKFPSPEVALYLY